VLLRIDLAWKDNADNETSFTIERSKLSGKKPQACVFETTFTVGANVQAYSDSSATTSTCKYRVAAKNSTGTSAFAEVSVTP
jgi:hypothetical protein